MPCLLTGCKSEPPSSGSGGTPTNCTNAPCTETKECCCCIKDIKIQNITRIDTDERMGHSFQTSFDLEYTGSGAKKRCTLEWWEKTNVPYVTGMDADTWTDMTQNASTAPSFNASWGTRREPCPGNETVTDTDPPSLGRRPGRTVTRTLDFKIVIKSGPGCSCGNGSLQRTAKQVLAMVNGSPDWANSSFTPP